MTSFFKKINLKKDNSLYIKNIKKKCKEITNEELERKNISFLKFILNQEKNKGFTSSDNSDDIIIIPSVKKKKKVPKKNGSTDLAEEFYDSYFFRNNFNKKDGQFINIKKFLVRGVNCNYEVRVPEYKKREFGSEVVPDKLVSKLDCDDNVKKLIPNPYNDKVIIDYNYILGLKKENDYQGYDDLILKKKQTEISSLNDLKRFNSPIHWKLIRSLNQSISNAVLADRFQRKYDSLSKTKELNNKFLNNIDYKTYININGKLIHFNTSKELFEAFTSQISNVDSKRLVFNYIDQDLLKKPLKYVFKKYPEIHYRKEKKCYITYEINQINPNKFKIVIMKFVDLEKSNPNDVDRINSYDVRASIIATKHFNPEIKFSYRAL